MVKNRKHHIFQGKPSVGLVFLPFSKKKLPFFKKKLPFRQYFFTVSAIFFYRFGNIFLPVRRKMRTRRSEGEVQKLGIELRFALNA